MSICGQGIVLYTDPSGEIVPIILAGAAIGAGFNLGVQLYQNDGDFNQVKWNQVAISGVAGGLGAGLGVGIGAAFGATTASNAALIIGLNGVGSGIIGGGAKYAENL